MRDRDPEQLNKKDDLVDVKELVRDAEPGPFTLDDILAEYGVKREPEPEAVPRRIESRSQPQRTEKDNVVLFPGARSAPVPERPRRRKKRTPGSRRRTESRNPERTQRTRRGRTRSPTTGWWSSRRRRASCPPFKGRHPKGGPLRGPHVPGVGGDGSGGDPPPGEADPRHRCGGGRARGVPRPLSPPPQAGAAAPGYRAPGTGPTVRQGAEGHAPAGRAGLSAGRRRLFQLAVPAAGFVWLPPLDGYQVQVWIAAGLLGAGILLSLDVLAAGIARMFRGRVGMDTLAALSGIFTLADALVLAVTQDREGQLPYSAAVLAGLFFLLHGTYHKKCGLRLSCRTAASVSEPYILTLDEGKWNGRDTYCKWTGTPNGFGSQIQMDDGAQRIYRVVCPVLLLACVLLSLLASYGVGKPQHLLWCLSATFTAAAAFGGALVYGRPFHKVARRLAQSGGALAGWPGMAQSRKGDRVLITDGDLFPPGYVELNGIKVFGDWSIEKVVGCTATLIRDSGSGLTKLFHDLLRAQGAIFRRADDLCCYEGEVCPPISGESRCWWVPPPL